MTTEASTELNAIAAIRLENLFAEIREEVRDYVERKGRPFQLVIDGKFTEDGRMVGDAIIDFKHRFDTQTR